MRRPALLFAIAGCLAFIIPVPTASGQASNLDTVEGPYPGERTTLTMTPHALSEEISARALGVRSPNRTRWALTLIGVISADSIALTLGDEPLPIKDISRPDEGEVGPTRLYLSGETFLTIAETSEVRLQVGDRSITIPEKMRSEMKKIFDKVS